MPRPTVGRSAATTVDGRRRERLRAFHPSVRDAVARLTSCNLAAEDLAESFPALLFALVTGYGGAQSREAAFRHVLDGGPLRLAAEIAGLPYWLRRLPAQAFCEPLGRLPCSESFEARVGHLVPTSRLLARPWLLRVTYAAEACDEELALWVARQFRLPVPEAVDDNFAYLVAWAWHADRKDGPAGRLLRRAWSPKLSLRRAEEETLKWRRRLSLAYALGPGLSDVWLEPGHVDGFDFVPLRTVGDFITESEVMDNCLDQYSDRMATGCIRVFSIRKSDLPVADIELGPIPKASDLPAIIQIKAARNRPAPLIIWRAAHAWLKAHAGRSMSRRPGCPRLAQRQQAQALLWADYLSGLPPHLRAHVEAILAREPLVRTSTRRRPAEPPRQTRRGTASELLADAELAPGLWRL